MKVAINRCAGGFNLSNKAIEAIMIRKGINFYRYNRTINSQLGAHYEYVRFILEEDRHSYEETLVYTTSFLGDRLGNIPDDIRWDWESLSRTDEDLIAVIEEFGEKASGLMAALTVVEIPDNIRWEIYDEDGVESIHELHRVWP